MESVKNRARHLRLVTGGGGAEAPAPMHVNLRSRLAPIPRWQLVMAVVSKVAVLASLYYLIKR